MAKNTAIFSVHRLSTYSSENSTITKCIPEGNIGLPTSRSYHKCGSGSVYFMDPCIEDCKLTLFHHTLL